MSDLRKAAEGAFAVLVLFSIGERPSASAVNDLIADLHAALAQPDESFCDAYCVWTDHHPDCALEQPEQLVVGGDDLPTLTKWTPRRNPLTESGVNEMYREMFCSPRGKTLTHQNWFQAGVLFAEKTHGIGGES